VRENAHVGFRLQVRRNFLAKKVLQDRLEVFRSHRRDVPVRIDGWGRVWSHFPQGL
jgi:REP element-mobilizing transposase RayT